MTDRGSDATVVTEAAPRSYEVQTPDGTYRRNRRHLVVLPHTSSTTPSFDEGSAESESMPRLTEESDACESNDEQPVLRRSGRASKPPDSSTQLSSKEVAVCPILETILNADPPNTTLELQK